MTYKIGYQTDKGIKRTQNQDQLGVFPEVDFFMVADGMGGHLGGETASQTAVSVISSFIQKTLSEKKDHSKKTILQEAFQLANKTISDMALSDPKLHGMGTTSTALFFDQEKLYIAHVGDSRCYYFQPQGFWQITKDHSLVEEKLKAGLISRSDLRTDRMKNVITRSVGFEKEVLVEIYEMNYQKGDGFLLCSDGLSNMIEDLQLYEMLKKYCITENAIETASKELIALANSRGGDDNISVILVQID